MPNGLAISHDSDGKSQKRSAGPGRRRVGGAAARGRQPCPTHSMPDWARGNRAAVGARSAAPRARGRLRGRAPDPHRRGSLDGRRPVGRSGCGAEPQVGGGHWGIRPCAKPASEVTVDRQLRSRPGLRFHRSSLPDDEVTTQRDPRHHRPPHAVRPRRRGLAPPARAGPSTRLRSAGSGIRSPWTTSSPGIRGAPAPRRSGPSIGAPAQHHPQRPGGPFPGLPAAPLKLPRPATNVPIEVNGAWIEADCVWREQRLIVELDGHAYPRHEGRLRERPGPRPRARRSRLARRCGSPGASCTMSPRRSPAICGQSLTARPVANLRRA